MENIKKSCIQHFQVDDEIFNYDILAGETGPSYTALSPKKI